MGGGGWCIWIKASALVPFWDSLWVLSFSLRCLTIQSVRAGTRAWHFFLTTQSVRPRPVSWHLLAITINHLQLLVTSSNPFYGSGPLLRVKYSDISLSKLGVGGGGGCIWIIASALVPFLDSIWDLSFSLRFFTIWSVRPRDPSLTIKGSVCLDSITQHTFEFLWSWFNIEIALKEYFISWYQRKFKEFLYYMKLKLER